MQNPIDPKQRERLAGARRRLISAVDLLERCKRCGLDVQEREELAFAISQGLDKIQENFIGEVNPVMMPVAPANPADQLATPEQVRKGKKR